MPPKAKIVNKTTGNASCTGRDITPLQAYVKDGSLPKGFLANLLAQSGYLHLYDAEPAYNECSYSFPNSDWFGVYLKDADGNYFYNLTNEGSDAQPGVFYFKIVNKDGKLSVVPHEPNPFEIPRELEGVRPCVINEKGKCGVPPKETASPGGAKAGRPPKTPKGAASSPVTIPDDVVQATVEALQLSPGAGPSTSGKEKVKSDISRAEVEAMDRKMIIAWISKNMKPEDVKKCLLSGGLSKEDEAEINGLDGDQYVGPSEVPGGSIIADAVEAARDMSPSVIQNMFKRISREQFKQEINGIKDPKQRKFAIVDLCQRAGLKFTAKELPNGTVRIIGNYGQVVDADEALSGCASVHAIRARAMLSQHVQRATGRARNILSGAKDLRSGIRERLQQAIKNNQTTFPSAKAPKLTPTQQTAVANIVEDMITQVEEGEYNDLVGFMNSVGITIEARDDGVYKDGKPIDLDPEHDEINDLIDKAALLYITKFNVSFGNRKFRRMSFGDVDGFIRDIKSQIMSKKFLNECIEVVKQSKLKDREIVKQFLYHTFEPLFKKNFNVTNLSELPDKLVDELVAKIAPHFNTQLSLAAKMSGPYAVAAIPAAKLFPTKTFLKQVFSLIVIKLRGRAAKTVTPAVAAFGRRRKAVCKRGKGTLTRSKVIKTFKCAAKKCKKSANYRRCMKTTLKKIYKRKSSFGKKSKSKKRKAVVLFKAAAKKCKGTKNYRACFTKTLRKMHKSSFGKRKAVKRKAVKRKVVPRNRSMKVIIRKKPGRKSPSISATSLAVGIIRRGNNGKMWKVKKMSNGVKRWVNV